VSPLAAFFVVDLPNGLRFFTVGKMTFSGQNMFFFACGAGSDWDLHPQKYSRQNRFYSMNILDFF
jgi:hypothetical protein